MSLEGTILPEMPILPPNVLVPVPCTKSNPVVVAAPEMVSPPVCVPLPMVVDAYEVSPPLNAKFVVVALPGNRYAKVDAR